MAGFTYLNSKLSVEGCKGITVSEIVPDAETGVYARLVSIYTDPETVSNRRPVLEILITDTVKGSLEIVTPNLEF